MAVCIDGALQINTELTAGGVCTGAMSNIHRRRIDSEAIKTAGDAADALSEVRSVLKELTNDPGVGFAYLKVAERLVMEFV